MSMRTTTKFTLQAALCALGVGIAVALCVVGAIVPAAPAWLTVLIAAACAAAAAAHGWCVVKVVFEIADPPKSPLESGRTPLAPPAGTMRGGWIIGVLERVSAAAAIGAGQFGVLAVIVAVKAVGRFGELDAPESRERFIIGTFAPLATAALWGSAALLWRG